MSDARQAIMHEREHRHPDLHEDQPVAAALGPAFVGFRYRFYTTTYQGNDALVAHIIDKIKHPSRSDCLKMVLDTFVAKMISTTPPAASRPGTTTANDIQDANGPCVAAVLAAYDEAVKTIGKTKTRLGLQADHVTCR
ncbi:hypothetical protein Daus18300_009977 [Diaporthe australafricana]|uniref:Uncharacterized protein n=1 Tax=Diaporthe australafricana TaxID=127596 RepID=A0ABR3WC60_9PEZI